MTVDSDSQEQALAMGFVRDTHSGASALLKLCLEACPQEGDGLVTLVGQTGHSDLRLGSGLAGRGPVLGHLRRGRFLGSHVVESIC